MPTFDPDPAVSIGTYMVTTITNAGTFTPTGGSALSFTPQLLYASPKYTPTELDTLRVDLMLDEDDEVQLLDNGNVEEIATRIFLSVQQRVANKTTAVAALINFVGALRDLFPLRQNVAVVGSQKVYLISKQVVLKYSPEELDKNDRFISVLAFGWSGFYE